MRDIDSTDPDGSKFVTDDCYENGIPDECEQSLMGGGGGPNSMSGEGGPHPDPLPEGEGAEAAWAEFFVWFEEQVFGEPGDWHTLTGPEKFERVMEQFQTLGLPYATPW